MSDRPVIAIGNFDGVHLGHQALLRRARQRADAAQVPLEVLTFTPHTRAYFRPHLPPFRLTTDATKIRLLTEICRVDHVHVRAFTKDFAATSAERFVNEVLLRDLHAGHVVVGEAFHFGQGGQGSTTMLQEWLATHQAGFTAVPAVSDDAGQRISATRIRGLLQEGKPQEAARLLGRPWSFSGRVEHGDARGRELGFPTANINLGDIQRPAFGVYACHAYAIERPEVKFSAVANIGIRPTVQGVKERCEVHIFGFNQSIYKEEWGIELVAFLRPEQQFASLTDLTSQITADCRKAKEILAASAA